MTTFRAAWSVMAVGLALAATGNRAVAQPRGAQPRVQLGVAIGPDTVVVGQPFRLSVRVRAPLGATIRFPEPPDTTSAVQGRAAPVVRASSDPAAVEQTAHYVLAAWDVDSQSVILGDVIVTAAGVERRVPVGPVGVYVRSILPEDSAERVPKPARDLIVGGIAPAWWWWLLAALAVLLALLGYLWWRRRGAGGAREDPYERAEREFARVEQLALVEAGERGRHVALMVEVLRDYLAARVPVALRSHTSGELLRATRAVPSIPEDRLARVLRETDLVKFARFPISAERALGVGAEAREIVGAVEQAMRAEEAAARAERGTERDAQRRAA